MNTKKLQSPYAELDPSQRYGRFKDVLGRGAMKTVYRAFDEFLGIEVAWNQVKLNHVFGSPDELHRLHSEVHLLKNLNHSSIMRSHAYWIDVDRRTFNFITEMFTSGTLREYRQKYTSVNTRAIKDWSRQILEGLDYLHCHDPPVIHRDLKCDNIFVNGHLGQIKIGDLGLAAILRGSHHAHSVIGTPEFMAPEMYEEDYDELVDIYSFGMCVIEMLTSEYPYNECSNPAQIYKKVTSGKLPQAFFQIEDAEARRFVGRCLGNVLNRPSAHELLMDPFLSMEEVDDLPAIFIPSVTAGRSKGLMPQPRISARRADMVIKGTMKSEDDTIYLKVHVTGCSKNIFFPFDITRDTALGVATEMVMELKELKIVDWEPFEIADMIDDEVSALVPSWKNTRSPEIHQQHSFAYFDHDDDDENGDNNRHRPFYFTSSAGSSQDSLPGLSSSNESQLHLGYKTLNDWFQEESNLQDDVSSDGSSLSPKYSNIQYFSENEDDRPSKDDPQFISRTQKCTRFCPGKHAHKNYNLDCRLKNQQKMVQPRSMVDIRSQLLHKTLVEEISKRRLFNTAGAVEDIGYREPVDFSSSKTRRGISQGKLATRSRTSHRRS